MKILKSIPYSVLVPVTLLFGLAPFVPQPHLVEKITMLVDGTLVRPVDIFDLVMHGSPALLLSVKLLVGRKGD